MATILVVDDRKLNREFLEMLLGYAGHTVIEASNGAEALERIREVRPDLVVTDIVMPAMNGIELVQRLHADPELAQIPVIFYTATYRLNEARKQAQACGVSNVIAKPSRPQVILETVASVLAAAVAPEDRVVKLTGLPRRPPKVLAETLSDKLDNLSLRLATLIELGLDLAVERDPQRLLEVACRAAEDMFEAHLTVIGMLGDSGKRPGRYAVRGVPEEMRPLFGELDLGTVLDDGMPHHFDDRAAAAAVLPAWHPHVGNLLIVPLKSAIRTLGWFYLADREGGEPFGDEDVQIAMTLALQLAQSYENLVLYSETSAYAIQLETEIVERKHVQYALHESEAHFRAVLDNAPIGMAVVSLAGQFMRVNCALGELVGYPKAELEKLNFHQIVYVDDPSAAMADLRALAFGELELSELERRYLHRDGGIGWMLLRASVLRNEEGDPLSFIVTIKDISEAKKADLELKLAASVFDHIMDGVMVLDTSAQIISVNPAFSIITGYGAEEAIGQTPCLMSSDQADQDFYCKMWESLMRDRYWEGEIWARRKDGEAFLEWLTVSVVPGPDGKPTRYVAVINDITELRRKDEHIRHLAFHDALTGLPNRALLLDRLEHSIVSAGRDKKTLSLMFIDLDHFKEVNDLRGHDIGDGLLQEMAHRLSQLVRQSDTIARMGGDEFVILLEQAHDIAGLARKAVASLSRPVEVGGHTVQVGASIGIARYPRDGVDVSELMKSADVAMYAAKSAGRGTFRFFRSAMKESAEQRIELETELRNAVSNGELELYYQPMVSLGSGMPFGVEALLRWRHPVRGLVMPADFIPFAEETGVIAELGDWVLEEVCRQCSAWQAQGLGRTRIAVTVAAKQLAQGDDLADRIVDITSRHGISPSDLEIKLAEEVILETGEHIERIIGRLREIGVAVAVDAFGAGSASLAYLTRLPIDILSIDRSFIRKADNDEEDAQVVRNVLELGRAHKLTVVAEGIETESQADFLRSCGCQVGQGYLYARPAPAKHVEVWLRGHANGDLAVPLEIAR